MEKKLLIGITGGIGSGKTVVSKMLARRGFKVFLCGYYREESYI
jgi:dephospho-CoA kinase